MMPIPISVGSSFGVVYYYTYTVTVLSIAFAFAFASLFLFELGDSFSACDNVDITFLIDTDSVVNNGDDVLSLISSIILDGSSEYSAFSGILYGDGIPLQQNAHIFNLAESVSEVRRAKSEQRILAVMETAFDAIINGGGNAGNAGNGNNNGNVKSVSIEEAFAIATNQQKPNRRGKSNGNKNPINPATEKKIRNSKKSLLARKEIGRANGYRMSLNEDEAEYFVFDYNNKLLDVAFDADLSSICELIEYERSDAEATMHFLMGHSFEVETEISAVLPCAYDARTDNATFVVLDGALLADARQMEILYDMTCPAYIAIPDFDDGFIDLGNHVQWVDTDTVIECSLVDVDEDRAESPLELDPTQSFILVYDFFGDDNTFKAGDNLMVYEDITAEMTALGCWTPVYIIEDMEIVEQAADPEAAGAYNVLRLSVSSPKSPMQYMLNVKLHQKGVGLGRPAGADAGADADARRRRMASESQSDADAGAGITFFDETFGQEWVKSKTTQASKTVGKFTFTGTGTLTLRVGYSFHAAITLDIDFDWSIAQAQYALTFVANIEYDFDAWFSAELVGTVTVVMNELLKFGNYQVLTIGPVPVVIKPFISLNAKLETLPLRVFAGVDCHYGETLSLGYYYYYDWNFFSSNVYDSNSYKTRTPDSNNGCTKTFEIGSAEENQEECPATELGFTIEIEPKLGVNLYAMVNVYGRAVLAIPFRIKVPEFNTAICPGVSCADDYLTASFTIAMDLSFYFGCEVDFSDILWVVTTLVGGNGADISISDDSLGAEVHIGTFVILPKLVLACLPLSGVLAPLNVYYKSQCCVTGSAASVAVDELDGPHHENADYDGADLIDYHRYGNSVLIAAFCLFALNIGCVGCVVVCLIRRMMRTNTKNNPQRYGLAATTDSETSVGTGSDSSTDVSFTQSEFE